MAVLLLNQSPVFEGRINWESLGGSEDDIWDNESEVPGQGQDHFEAHISGAQTNIDDGSHVLSS